jgi:hypothetical protein
MVSLHTPPTPTPRHTHRKPHVTPLARHAQRLSLLAAALVLIVLLPGSADAATGHGFAGSFGPGGPGVGSFSNAQGIAVDQATSDVYVYDSGEGGRVYKFNSTGEPENFSLSGKNVIEGVGGSGADENEIAVDSSTGPAEGDIYVANNTEVRIYSATGEALGALTGGEACGVAVDPAGDVYVSFYPSEVREYTPTENPVSVADYTSSLAGLDGVCNIAADAAGDIYADTYSDGPVNEYPAAQFGAGDALGTVLEGASGGTLAVDPLTGAVFVDAGNEVAEFDSSGNPQGTFAQTGAGALSGSYGVAVNDTSNDVYVANGEQAEIFDTGQLPEVPSTLAASDTTGTTAMLHGKLNPGASAKTGYYFAYNTGSQCTGGNTTPVSGEVEGQNIEESALVTELEGDTQYSVCLVATNTFGSTPGAAMTLTTSPEKPIVLDESSSVNGPTEATLSAELIPENQATTYHFEYGTEVSYGMGIPIPDADIGSSRTTVNQTINGLQPGTTYHYRIVATNNAGTQEGPDQILTTPPLPPTVTSGQVSNITTTTATLSGTINPNGADTKYYFAYGIISPSCNQFDFFDLGPCVTKAPMSEGDAGSGSGATPVTVELKGLTPATTYSYVLNAGNAGGRTISTVLNFLTFTTLPLPPVVTTLPVSDVGMTNATGVGVINPQGGDTTYHFEYGLTTSYGAVAPLPNADAGSGAANTVISTLFASLRPGSEYHYRLVATNAGGTTYGPDETFITYEPYATAPSALTTGTSALAPTSVTLDGVLNPHGNDTVYHFEYGTNTSYGSVTPVPNADAGAGATDVAISESLTGLQPGTTYHYRLIANNAGGTIYGSDQTFTTLGTAPAGSSTPPATAFPDLSSVTPTPPPTTITTQTKTPKAKPLTRAEKLTKALRTCAKQPKKKRAACVKQARKKYAPAAKKYAPAARKKSKKK